ncbi:MAG: VanZ family protein [Clostridia bacterium]|nr:VanZ family protein [Clostridia bacterium]
MSLSGILIYCLRAATFAVVTCALYALVCLLRGRKLRPGRLVALAYLAALIQITVLRGGVDWAQLMTTTRDAPRLVPLQTTMEELRAGAWPLIYHAVGNMIWFVPLGALLRKRSVLVALLAGAGASVCIELMQYLLMTGVTDVDDVIFNALGALLGWTLARLTLAIFSCFCYNRAK